MNSKDMFMAGGRSEGMNRGGLLCVWLEHLGRRGGCLLTGRRRKAGETEESSISGTLRLRRLCSNQKKNSWLFKSGVLREDAWATEIHTEGP